MPYGSKTRVKLMLHISALTTAWDDEIDEMLDDADNHIDNEIGQYVTVPLTTVPSMIIMAANDIAAGFFCENNLEQYGERIPIFVTRGEKRLKDYIRKQYGLWP